jgi:hypothetical protein
MRKLSHNDPFVSTIKAAINAAIENELLGREKANEG